LVDDTAEDDHEQGGQEAEHYDAVAVGETIPDVTKLMWGVVVTRQEEQQSRKVRERGVGGEDQDPRRGPSHNVRPDAPAAKGGTGKLHNDRRLRVGEWTQADHVGRHR